MTMNVGAGAPTARTVAYAVPRGVEDAAPYANLGKNPPPFPAGKSLAEIAARRRLFETLLILVGTAPDAHLLGILDELLAEVGVGDIDDLLRALPGGKTLQVDHAVLGDDVVDTGAGVGGDGAVGQGGDDAALQAAVLAGEVEDMQIKLLPPLDR